MGAGAGEAPMGYGVIGSPTDSGSVSLGSSPGTPAPVGAQLDWVPICGPSHTAPLCSGLARRPLKAVAPVRIRSGLQHSNPSDLQEQGEGPPSLEGRSV